MVRMESATFILSNTGMQSKLWPFILGLMYVGLSTSCSDTEYVLETSGECISCRDCRAGFQPKIPCGSTVGIHDSIGICEECPSGTSSEKKDTKSCQICRSKMCFQHQVFEGTCAPTKDTSKCTNKCDDGYQMNILGTKCEVHRPQASTARTPTNDSPMPTMLTTKNNTTKKLDVPQNQRSEEAGLHVGYIILIVVIVVLGIIVIIWKFVLPKLRLTRTNAPKDPDDVESSNSESSQESEANETEPLKFSQQEKSKQAEKKEMHYKETSVANVQHQAPDPVTPSEMNEGFTGSIPPSREHSLDSDVLVKSPVQEQQSTRIVNQQPPLVPNAILHYQPSMYCTNYTHTNGTNNAWQSDGTRVTSLPSKLYYEICNKIDAGAHGKNWRDLAGWFDFTADQVQLFEREKHPTDAIIRSWSTEAANDIETFIGILKENKLTYLVDRIEKECALIV